ncbi:hypothetical protein NE237_030345 [Protea cynaroides]|uniref:K+ potassium transporter integral membrane domain-containing protein n=1 Tax=Protea cynaroides TaxID=273540 RepID=A0A9Q0GVS4_9MAGN|nr:hypothetical protein NE237_030345 [Protea cynaroides]
MWISVVILILLFQRFGTDTVGFTFAPILIIWFLFISVIGLYNFIRYDLSVNKAINPMYIVTYFQRNKKNAWISLGGDVQCLTGSEALFADLGHFNVRSIQISTCTVVFSSIVMAYVGQAAHRRKHPLDGSDALYQSVPKPAYWPMLAAIVASQSLISASFSIVQQSLALGCFPRVKVVYTSPKYEGQVYVPDVNNFLMYGYKDVEKEPESFEYTLVNGLKDFIQEHFLKVRSSENGELLRIDADEAATEVQLVDNEINKGGIIYMFGESEVVASKASSLGKKLIIDYAYGGLKKMDCRVSYQVVGAAQAPSATDADPREDGATILADVQMMATAAEESPALGFLVGNGRTYDLVSHVRVAMVLSQEMNSSHGKGYQIPQAGVKVPANGSLMFDGKMHDGPEGKSLGLVYRSQVAALQLQNCSVVHDGRLSDVNLMNMVSPLSHVEVGADG